MDETFGRRVAAEVAKTGPLCAGIDPSPALLLAWGLTEDAQGLARFSHLCLEAFAGVVPVVKPQVAFFERHASAGLAVLESLLAEARSAGLLVIADAKRGDIDSTSAAYADAWLGTDSPLAADAVTALPYMGLGALEPLFQLARATGRGVLVVARSSNPEGRLIQEAVAADGQSVEDGILAGLATLNAQGPPGTFGAVVGATLQPSAFSLPELGGPLLAPGVGSQGGTPEAVAKLFAGCPPGSVLPNVSRSVLGAGPSVAALRRAATEIRDKLGAALA